jgi:hypothetical protein
MDLREVDTAALAMVTGTAVVDGRAVLAVLERGLDGWLETALEQLGPDVLVLAPAARADALARALVAAATEPRHGEVTGVLAAPCVRELLPAALATCHVLATDGATIPAIVRTVTSVAPFGHTIAVDLVQRCVPGHWDALAVAAAITAAIATSRARRHDANVASAALGMTATQAPHLDAGIDTASVVAARLGRIAASTVVAVLAAEAGLSGPQRPLGGERGLLAVLGRSRVVTSDARAPAPSQVGARCALGEDCPFPSGGRGAEHVA